jgi:hypothetical protein
MPEIRMMVAGADPSGVLEELALWLGQEAELRGLVQPKMRAPEPGQLGVVTDVLIAAVSTGGAISVLAASLHTFVAQPRRSDVSIKVQGPDGRQIEIDAKRANPAAVESLLRQVLGKFE